MEEKLAEPRDAVTVELRRASTVLDVTVRHGDVLAESATVCLLKYAQALHGVDRAIVGHLAESDEGLLRRLPLPGGALVVPAQGAQLPFDHVVVVGTETLGRLGPAAIRDWARLGMGVCMDLFASRPPSSPVSLATTVQGVRIAGGSHVEPEVSLANMVDGFLDALTEAPPSALRHLRIVIAERDEATAQRLAAELRRLESEAAPPEPPRQLTPTVVSIRAELGEDEAVSAGRMADEVRLRHPEYGGGRLRQCRFDQGGPAATVGSWLARIAGLYRSSARPGSELVLTGRHVIVGLSLLDDGVNRVLVAAGAHDAILAELREKPVDPRERQDVRWVPDLPVDSRGDGLGRVLVARSLARHLVDLDRERPGVSFALLLDGRWGAGKTSVATMLVEELERLRRSSPDSPAPPPAATVVRFDAWRQSRSGPPWLRLMGAMREGLGTTRRRAWLLAAAEGFRAIPWWRRVLSAALLALIAAFLVVWGVRPTLVHSMEQRVGATVSVATVVWFVRTMQATLVPRTGRDARSFVDRTVEPMEELAKRFDWLRCRSSGPVVLLIDDLDRCDAPYVVELLDTVQKLVRNEQRPAAGCPGIFIVVAADGRWLRAAYEVAHSGQSDAIGQPGRPLGSLFLDKLFQVRIPLPELSPQLQTRYLAAVLNQAGGSADGDPAMEAARREIRQATDREAALDVMRRLPPTARLAVAPDMLERLESADSAHASEAQHALTRFGGLLEPNPRSVLRFVMAFSALRAARLAEGNPVSTDSLALWTIVSVRWPALAEFLTDDPDERVPLFRADRSTIEARVPPGLAGLFTSTPDELRNVFNHENGGPLDAVTIKQCAGLA